MKTDLKRLQTRRIGTQPSEVIHHKIVNFFSSIDKISFLINVSIVIFFLDHQMTSSKPLTDWVVIVPAREAHAVDTVVSNMQKVADPIRFRISRPKEMYVLNF